MKNKAKTLVGKLIVNIVLEKLWTHLTVYFITELLLVGKNTILVVYNRPFKITYFVVMIKEISAKRLDWLFWDNVQKLYRLLESIILDRKSQFAVKFTKKLNKILKIEIKLLTVFYL